jgi:hypothetical protein
MPLDDLPLAPWSLSLSLCGSIWFTGCGRVLVQDPVWMGFYVLATACMQAHCALGVQHAVGDTVLGGQALLLHGSEHLLVGGWVPVLEV